MTMQVRYVGNPDENDTRDAAEMHGRRFVVGEVVDVSDLPEDMQRRLAGNSHFHVMSQPAADAPKKRGRPRKVRDE